VRFEWDPKKAIANLTMKKEYDFSAAEKGKFSRPVEELEIPVYLDRDIVGTLSRTSSGSSEDLSALVNKILRKEIELMEMLGE